MLARTTSPAALAVARVDGGWAQVTLQGWMSARSLRADHRDGLDLAVIAPDGENLRAEPDGPIIARVRYGALLERLDTRGVWVQVRRVGWVPRSALAPAAVAALRPPRASTSAAPMAYQAMSTSKRDTSAAQAAAQSPSGLDRVELSQAAALFLVPEGGQLGSLQPGTSARVLSRSGDWVRIQTEGWVRDAELRPATGSSLAGVSAAEVRASPDRYVGQTLDWRLQIVSIQTADELRPEIPLGQPYLLTRGPMPEPGFVYVIIPRDQVERFRALGPLTELMLRVRIRAARTRYLATPVAELVGVTDSVAARR